MEYRKNYIIIKPKYFGRDILKNKKVIKSLDEYGIKYISNAKKRDYFLKAYLIKL